MGYVDPDPWIEQVQKVIKITLQYGMIDGEHHKQWLLDQILRICLEEFYDKEIEKFNADKNYKEWDVGIPP
jgi:hypothetical protein